MFGSVQLCPKRKLKSLIFVFLHFHVKMLAGWEEYTKKRQSLNNTMRLKQEKLCQCFRVTITKYNKKLLYFHSLS